MLKVAYSEHLLEAGCDEVGRGCLAGPVVAAAVILPRDYRNNVLNDSKALTKKKRSRLKDEIMNEALAYGIGVVDNREIDRINILNASFLAMHKALGQLKQTPELLLIDGNRFKPYNDIPHECVVKGDGIYMSIAAASVLAKTYRDELMCRLSSDFPQYGWDRNVGYPTRAHRIAIKQFGVSPLHRMSFRLLPDQLELFSGNTD
jgi:ribonuclease HII